MRGGFTRNVMTRIILQVYTHTYFNFHKLNNHNQTICARHCQQLYQQDTPLYRQAFPSNFLTNVRQEVSSHPGWASFTASIPIKHNQLSVC